MLDKLVHPDRLPTHGAESPRNLQARRGRSHKGVSFAAGDTSVNGTRARAGDDQVRVDLSDGLAFRPAVEHGVQYVAG
ncbi:hypothetical protein [Actinomadura kijaniata]|uniref:hypothetical protein n=1 Tax=Actinomadura kijaniata TaxID=46161 RepID=UPI00157C306B|nr:hypothetical protein [Actinomadura kijaniata]